MRSDGSARAAAGIALKSVSKTFGAQRAVDDVTIDIEPGEFISLLGPSGCGKTTLLRIIAGYGMPSSGQVFVDSRDVTSVPPRHREIGTVFQNYALFPHMTVAKNVGFGLSVRRKPRREIQERVGEMLDLVGLSDYADAHPSALSGGMRQRVALARALAFRPRILLMDEPFAALDTKLRKSMQQQLRQIQSELKITTVFITHDQEEALGMSDRVAVLAKGTLHQFDTVREIYHHPRTRFVADFVGSMNLFDAKLVDGRTYQVGGGVVLAAASTAADVPMLGVRAESVRIARGVDDLPAERANCFDGRVVHHRFTGSTTEFVVDVAALDVSLRALSIGGRAPVDVGDACQVWFSPDDVVGIPD